MTDDPRVARADIAQAVDGRTLCHAFATTAERLADRQALKWLDSSGWQALTWSEYRQRVRDLSLGLQGLGFESGNAAVLMAGNRPEHVIADLAVIHAGGIPVSVYNSLAPDQIKYLLNHCEATLAVVESGPQLSKLLSIRAELPHLRSVVLMDEVAPGGGDWTPWASALEIGRRRGRATPTAFDRGWQRIRPDHMATLVYTSGTTGPPKGVMLTHANVMWTMEAVRRAADPDPGPGDRLISYLPLAHVLERWWSHWNGVIHGVTTHFCRDPDQLLTVLLAVRPTWFFGVPRVWDRMAAGLLAAVASDPDGERRTATGAAIETGRSVFRAQRSAAGVPPDLEARCEAVRAILAAVLAKLGLDQCRLAASGSAPISMEALELFRGLGLALTDGWGMTELTGNGAWGGCGETRIGTVGRPLPGIEVRTAEDGELLVRGGNVMAGYYRDPEATTDALTEDGWLRTGDLGRVDVDGYLTLVGRKKDILITTGGKNISPTNLENLLERHPLVGHACVVGDGRPYLCALMVLDPDEAPQWAAARSMEPTALHALASDPSVLAEIERSVEEVNRQVSRPEAIRRFRLLPAQWTVEGGEITPTHKVKRSAVTDAYADVIDEMYR
jgi:long-chain acyl-CoA synthetase